MGMAWTTVMGGIGAALMTGAPSIIRFFSSLFATTATRSLLQEIARPPNSVIHLSNYTPKIFKGFIIRS